MGELKKSNCESWKVKVHKTKEWVVQHKTEIIVGAATITIIVGGFVVWNNKATIFESIQKIKPSLKLTTPKTSPVIKSIPAATTARQTAQVATASSNSIGETARTVCEHQRSEFIRTLHNGWNTSPAKIAEAAERGVELQMGETLVKSCLVGSKCA